METVSNDTKLLIELFFIGDENIDNDKTISGIDINGIPWRDIKFQGKQQPFYKIDVNGISYPNPRVIEIGKELYKLGGISMMERIYHNIKSLYGVYGSNLSKVWDKRVGEWIHQ